MDTTLYLPLHQTKNKLLEYGHIQVILIELHGSLMRMQ
jgi:hypothetical protein